MALPRMDHVVIVVEDMAAAIAFFEELGLELENGMPVEGTWVDRVNGLADVRDRARAAAALLRGEAP